MLREEKTRIIGKIRDSIDKIDNLVKSKAMSMWRKGKVGIVDLIGKERETEKRQKRISDQRQRMAKILKKFNDAREVEERKSVSMGGLRSILRFSEYMEEVTSKYINFWLKNGVLIERYLIKWIQVFQPQKNQKDTAQWYNLEDVKSKEDLKACWNFIMEWKRFFGFYRKLEWGQKKGSREKIIMANYYMRHRGKELRAEGKNRGEIYKTITKEVTQIFQYCPGVGYYNYEINVKKETIQSASRFWHILGDKTYDRNEFKNLRVTYTERDGKKKSIPLKTWYRKEKSKLTKI